MESETIAEVPAAESRQEALLDAAIGVFARYGFRKTSMDEVARAAGVSRQGLYLLFNDKEELFRKSLTHKLNCQLKAVTECLSASAIPIESRLVAACDEWAGRHVGMFSTDAADLMCASTALAGNTLTHYLSRFEHALADAIAVSPLADCCAANDLTPADVALALHATTRGLKHSCKTREEFVQGITTTVRMLCASMTPRIVQ